ncbi:MAG: circadian clock KaiB family protein [Thermodesulfobacteriota bacterium]
MKTLLKLYIVGNTFQPNHAVTKLKDICDSNLGSDYELEIIDVLEHPELAEKDNIVVTPTLIKMMPTPVKILIGDLYNAKALLLGLEKEEQE